MIAPILLIASVVLSFAAALGVSGFAFTHIFGFAGADQSFPLFTFVFLVALGIDYNIFLMTRVREETLEFGTRDGIRRGLAVTGGVITSAGVVLAATFAVLGYAAAGGAGGGRVRGRVRRAARHHRRAQRAGPGAVRGHRQVHLVAVAARGRT